MVCIAINTEALSISFKKSFTHGKTMGIEHIIRVDVSAFVLTVNQLREIPYLLRGEVEKLKIWLLQPAAARVVLYSVVIAAGAGMYGAAIGSWRSPLMAAYVAAKFPLILLLTALGNALLNGMLAQLIGLGASFRQVSLAILMSFAITAAILGAFSPIVYFMVLNLPPLSPDYHNDFAYALLMVSQVAIIAFAGITANVRLLQLLQELSGGKALALKVLVAWLGGNLLLGMQLTWILRPFFGNPDLPVQFLRANAFQGNFIEGLIGVIQSLYIR